MNSEGIEKSRLYIHAGELGAQEIYGDVTQFKLNVSEMDSDNMSEQIPLQEEQQIPSTSNQREEQVNNHPLSRRVELRINTWAYSKWVSWVYITLLVIIGIIKFSVAIAAQSEMNSLTDSSARLFAMETITTWQQRFILDILITKSPTCPRDFEDALDYEWPGTVRGCACPYSVGVTDTFFVMRGQCNE